MCVHVCRVTCQWRCSSQRTLGVLLYLCLESRAGASWQLASPSNPYFHSSDSGRDTDKCSNAQPFSSVGDFNLDPPVCVKSALTH